MKTSYIAKIGVSKYRRLVLEGETVMRYCTSGKDDTLELRYKRE